MQTLRVVAAQAVSVPRKGTVDLSDESSWSTSDGVITTCFARELCDYELNRCAVGKGHDEVVIGSKGLYDKLATYGQLLDLQDAIRLPAIWYDIKFYGMEEWAGCLLVETTPQLTMYCLNSLKPQAARACLTEMGFLSNIPAGFKLEDVVSLACQAPAHLKQLQLLSSGLGTESDTRLNKMRRHRRWLMQGVSGESNTPWKELGWHSSPFTGPRNTTKSEALGSAAADLKFIGGHPVGIELVKEREMGLAAGPDGGIFPTP